MTDGESKGAPPSTDRWDGEQTSGMPCSACLWCTHNYTQLKITSL